MRFFHQSVTTSESLQRFQDLNTELLVQPRGREGRWKGRGKIKNEEGEIAARDLHQSKKMGDDESTVE